jgi:ABC-type Fe3+/spermidine/putrescine transport system ATPase subunit
LNITTIFVTHDQFEAMSISDRILVMREGVIQQIGSPIDIYERPTNEFIAGFVGFVNFLDGKVEKVDSERGRAEVSTPIGRVQISTVRSLTLGDQVKLVIRPETINISGTEPKGVNNTFPGEVEIGMYVGSVAKYTALVKGEKIIIDHSNPRETLFRSGEEVYLTFPDHIHLLLKN